MITFANMNNIFKIKLLQIGIELYLKPKYLRIDLFANIKLFTEQWLVRFS